MTRSIGEKTGAPIGIPSPLNAHAGLRPHVRQRMHGLLSRRNAAQGIESILRAAFKIILRAWFRCGAPAPARHAVCRRPRVSIRCRHAATPRRQQDVLGRDVADDDYRPAFAATRSIGCCFEVGTPAHFSISTVLPPLISAWRISCRRARRWPTAEKSLSTTSTATASAALAATTAVVGDFDFACKISRAYATIPFLF